MSLTKLLVPTYRPMLKALSSWLEKAQEQMPQAEAQALLAARLAPDMFPLSTQIRFACVQVHEAVFRLTGQPYAPSVRDLLEEGRDAAAQPGSFSDAQARINETIALLDTVAPDAPDMDPATPIAHELSNGMIFDLTAEQYARDWTLAQFYFHLMTAYAILRAQNVELGKADYIRHLLPYLRSE